MPVVCPTITAETPEAYKSQMEKVTGFAHRVHIDLADGQFAPSRTVSAAQAWWPVGVKADFHIMHRHPLSAAETILKHKPNLIIAHAEAEGSFREFADYCRQHRVAVGVALLAATPAEAVIEALGYIDHVLIFSGNLGYQGGSRADLNLLNKLSILRARKPQLEIGWDGGVSTQNVAQLVFGGVDVINAGSFIQTAEDPKAAYEALNRIADETGTT